MMRPTATFLLLSLFVFGGLVAGEKNNESLTVVKSFHEALVAGDRDRVLKLLDPAVVILEQGGAEMSRDEYASHHLGDDMEFSKSTNQKVVEQRTGTKGEVAWVLTISETSGSFGGKDVSSRNAETMLLQRKAGEWRIAHIHWSSRRKEAPKP